MIITCENCTAKFNLDESLLSPNGSKVRCSQCAHLFLAFPKGYGPEKSIPPSMEVKKISTEEVDPPKPDERIDEPPSPLVSESVETKLESPQTELDSPFPSPDDTLKRDDIDFDTDLDLDMELDFSDTDFDFDEIGLDLDGPASDDAGDVADDESLTQESTTAHDTEDNLDLDFDLDLDLDLDMELGLDVPGPDDAGEMHDDPVTQETITPHDTEDDLDLELDLDLDMELGLDDPTPDDAGEMHDDSLIKEAITPRDTEDDFDLELDLDMDMELNLDDSSQDDPGEIDDGFNLELDLDEDDMATPDGTQAPDSDSSPENMDNNGPHVILEKEDPLAKKDIPKEPGDDTPIAPSSTTEPLHQYPPIDIEKKSSPIVKLFIFFILLLILLLGAHAASLITGITIPFVSDLNIPFLTELVTPEPPPPPPIRLVPDKNSINGRFEINQKEGTLFVITGNIHNTSQVTCTNVRVTASLINTEKAKIKSKTVLCGVTIPAQQLATLEISAMDKTLSNPDPQMSFPLAPGQYSPFMIIFSKLPDNLENFTVTVDKFNKN